VLRSMGAEKMRTEVRRNIGERERGRNGEPGNRGNGERKLRSADCEVRIANWSNRDPMKNQARLRSPRLRLRIRIVFRV
jgi:hypothetical protein